MQCSGIINMRLKIFQKGHIKRMVKKIFQTPSSKIWGRGGRTFTKKFFFKWKNFFPKHFSNVFYTILHDLVLKTLREELRQVQCMVFFYNSKLSNIVHANPKIFFIVTLLRFANVPKTFFFHSFLVASQKVFQWKQLKLLFVQLFKILQRQSIGRSLLFLLKNALSRFWNDAFGRTLYIWMIFRHMLLHIESPQRLLAIRTWHRIVYKRKRNLNFL